MIVSVHWAVAAVVVMVVIVVMELPVVVVVGIVVVVLGCGVTVVVVTVEVVILYARSVVNDGGCVLMEIIVVLMMVDARNGVYDRWWC